ncbi:MAG TPA: hypothetical protein VGQ31_02245 [Candidatus Limnocylindrales bacterium]|nr:hypothetical protein [Candidatus Limnocylindrales bacterium]
MRDHSRQLVVSLILGFGAIATAILAPSATLAATTGATQAVTGTTTCDEGRWPVSVQGQPLAFHAGARAGDYLWHSATGWHLRVTHPGSTRVSFSGSVVSNAPMTVTGYRLERGDSFTLSADKLTLTYHVADFGHIDGIDFRTACATRLRIKGSMSGTKLPVGRIWIGRAGHHPLQNPFVILRNR